MAVPVPASATSSQKIRGTGKPPWYGKPGEARHGPRGYGVTGCGGKAENKPSWQQFPRGRSGEKYLGPRGASPVEQRSCPRVSVVVETLVKPDNVFSIRPGQARRKGLERLPAESLASIRPGNSQESCNNQAGIRDARRHHFPCRHRLRAGPGPRWTAPGAQDAGTMGSRGKEAQLVNATHRQGPSRRPPRQHTRGLH
jgi:hypothetical protein